MVSPAIATAYRLPTGIMVGAAVRFRRAGTFPDRVRKLVAVWRTQPRHELAELARVTAPTLVLMGDNDVLTIEHAGQMKQAIPGAQLAVIPGTDHGVMFEKPSGSTA